MDATPEEMAALLAEAASLRAETAALRAGNTATSKVLAAEDNKDKVNRRVPLFPHLVDDEGNPGWAGRKTDVYELVINKDRSIVYDAAGKFTIKKVGEFDFLWMAAIWTLKEKGPLPPSYDESKGQKGVPAYFGFGLNNKGTLQEASASYDDHVAVFGTLIPFEQKNEFKRDDDYIAYTTPEQYLLVKRVYDIESKTDFVNVLPAAVRIRK
jgi:hypothetical protein